ncbi:MAG: DUF551 domain-containing protein [Methanoregulaceae archaeon]|nr:DUF551 domain-containing protein [Methanoregulaceae archaeon]
MGSEGWIKVEDQRPRTYTTVFIYSMGDVCIAQFDGSGWYAEGDVDDFWAEPILGVTHWMEIDWPDQPEVD